MTKTDKILFLLSILFLGLFAALGQGSSELRELPLETPVPMLTIRGVDLNSADADELCALPGVGPVIAERILEKRVELGGFSCMEELRTVKGIGEKTLEGIYAYMENE